MFLFLFARNTSTRTPANSLYTFCGQTKERRGKKVPFGKRKTKREVIVPANRAVSKETAESVLSLHQDGHPFLQSTKNSGLSAVIQSTFTRSGKRKAF